mmetsp:Transcript_27567/g.88704  ORF Transcript_27567/g.88704 Transcript_27567/m.88704 type:complete len:320 (-) Transcript_27567:2182-3141(-)
MPPRHGVFGAKASPERGNEGAPLAVCSFWGVTLPIMHAAAYSLSVRTIPREPARCGDEDRRARRSSVLGGDEETRFWHRRHRDTRVSRVAASLASRHAPARRGHEVAEGRLVEAVVGVVRVDGREVGLEAARSDRPLLGQRADVGEDHLRGGGQRVEALLVAPPLKLAPMSRVALGGGVLPRRRREAHGGAAAPPCADFRRQSGEGRVPRRAEAHRVAPLTRKIATGHDASRGGASAATRSREPGGSTTCSELSSRSSGYHAALGQCGAQTCAEAPVSSSSCTSCSSKPGGGWAHTCSPRHSCEKASTASAPAIAPAAQ